MLVHNAARLLNSPLWVERHYAEVVATVLAPRLGIQPIVKSEAVADVQPAAVRSPLLTKGGVLIVPVVGALMHRGDWIDAYSGAESYTNIQNQLVAALQDDDVKGILLDIDSPGGQAGGCLELADTIMDARKSKPIWAIANSDACSAAYAIGASAERFYGALSSEVGSIGVVMMHTDVSKMMDKMGVVTTFVFAGAHKVDGNPFEPLPKAVRAEFQAAIDLSYTRFVEAVAMRRPLTVEQVRATEARIYSAQEAADLKLIDGVMSLQAVTAAMEEFLLSPTSTAPSVVHTREGSPVMTTPAPAAPQNTPAAITPEAHAQAVEAARVAGYAAGRTDAAAIMGSEHARGREPLAAKLAGDASMSSEKALDFLQTAPPAAAPAAEKPAGQLNALMQGKNPNVSNDGGPAVDDAKTARIASLAATAKQFGKRH